MDELSTYPPFATASDFATYIKRDLSGPDTATVELLLAASSLAIRRYCEWQVWPQVEADAMLLDGPGGPELKLPVRYVTEITSITENGTVLDVDPTTGTVNWSTKGLIDKSGAHWTTRKRGVSLVVTHGLVNVPDDLVTLCCGVTGRQFVSPGGAIREQAGQVSITYSQVSSGVAGTVVLTKSERDVLVNYRGGYR